LIKTNILLKLGANATGISARLEAEIDKLPRVEGAGAGQGWDLSDPTFIIPQT